MALTTTSLEYRTSWLADFFHKFPHIDLSFEKTNSSFNPENVTYREALGIWAGLPVLGCALLWVTFLIFFCLRCCRKSERKQTKMGCSRVSAGLFLFLACGALGAAFYGNEAVHSGVNSFVDAVQMTNTTVENSLVVLNTLDSLAETLKTKDVPALQNAVNTYVTNTTTRTAVLNSITQIVTNCDLAKGDLVNVRKNATQVNTETVVHYTQMTEFYRWVSTVMVFCVFVIIFLVVFIGLLRRSKWMLMVAATLSVIFMLFVWLAAAVYLALSVAGGDLCVDPNTFVVSKMEGTIQKAILLDFINCNDASKQPYLLMEILDAQQQVTQAITALNTTVNISAPYTDKLFGPVGILRQDLRSVAGNISSLGFLVGSCDTIHGEYIEALNGICHTALIGVGFLVLFSALVGLLGAVLVFCTALAWPHFGRRRQHRHRDHDSVDDTDPFLPNPPPYDQDYGSMRQANITDAAGSAQPVDHPRRMNEDRRPVHNLPVGESPPPAYQSVNYMQQYYNLAPRPSSIQQASSDA